MYFLKSIVFSHLYVICKTTLYPMLKNYTTVSFPSLLPSFSVILLERLPFLRWISLALIGSADQNRVLRRRFDPREQLRDAVLLYHPRLLESLE